MSFRDRFKNKKGSLGKQHVAQTKNTDSKGRFPTIIRKDLLPAGMEVWVCKEGDHLLDILPWPAGPDMPLSPDTGDPVVAEGDLSYVLDIAVHTNVGSMKVPYVCPYENFGLPCPICEYVKETDLSKEDWSALKAKRRVLYFIWLHDNRDTQKKGIQLTEFSYFSMEEKLAAIAALPKGGGATNFSDPDDGKSIAFTRKGSGAKNTQYLGYRFIDREIRIPDKLLDQLEKLSLDQFVKMHPTYEEIEEAFKGQRSKISTTEDVENAGNNFSDHSTGDDVPDFMDEYDKADSKPNRETRKSATAPSKPAVKKKLILKKK